MKLKKCLNHKSPEYTLKDLCPICKASTKDAHYKFIKTKDAEKEEKNF